MLRFLLDEHLSAEIVAATHALRQDVVVMSLHEWEEGRYQGAADSAVLAGAYEQGLTLVTYDQKTIPPLLVSWGERDIPHAGVIFGSSQTIPTSGIGAIARALIQIWQAHGNLDWTNRVAYHTRRADDSPT